MKRRRAAHETRTTPDVDDLEDLFDVLRQNLARADAMVCATEHQLERFSWVVGNASDETEDDDRGRRLDHLAHLLGATKESVGRPYTQVLISPRSSPGAQETCDRCLYCDTPRRLVGWVLGTEPERL